LTNPHLVSENGIEQTDNRIFSVFTEDEKTQIIDTQFEMMQKKFMKPDYGDKQFYHDDTLDVVVQKLRAKYGQMKGFIDNLVEEENENENQLRKENEKLNQQFKSKSTTENIK